MGVKSKLSDGFNRLVDQAGTQIRVRYFDTVFDDVYDEATDLVQSGTDLWTSGIVMSINNRRGSDESVLVEQGKLIDSDKRLYVNGSLTFTSGGQKVDVMLGSNGQLFTTIPIGGIAPEVENTKIYKKQFLRRLTGSLI